MNVLDLIPNYYREVKDKKRLSKLRDEPVTFLVNENRPYQLSDGLQNRHIALWASHGWYYDQKSDRWRWQRARLFETVEDKLPLSFVIPYLLTMLENAGAYVWMPRERDVQENEVIVDNDGSSEGSLYREHGNDDLFRQGGSSGFAHKRSYYIEHQNPFTEGTYRTMKGGDEQEAVREW